MKHEQVMFMELANGQSNVTMGMIPSICFSISKVSLHFTVQVVKEAPFKCLISLPFVKNGFSDLTKEQIGQDQSRKDITNDHQGRALKEGCCEREWAWESVSLTEKTKSKSGMQTITNGCVS